MLGVSRGFTSFKPVVAAVIASPPNPFRGFYSPANPSLREPSPMLKCHLPCPGRLGLRVRVPRTRSSHARTRTQTRTRYRTYTRMSSITQGQS
eukprot:scaffold113627_cov17-Prasinocladus_malaysianus.AAC.1